MRALVIAITLAASIPALASDARPPVEATRPAPRPRYFSVLSRPLVNQHVANEIATRLRAIRLKCQDVQVEVRDGGRVILTGYVRSRDDLMRVDRVTRQSLGVRRVENRLKVLPGPPVADETDLSLL